MAWGKFPSGLFGANAAWWHVMILAFNLNTAMKHIVLGKNWINRRLKAIRFHLINISGMVLKGVRTLVVRLLGASVEEIIPEAGRSMLSIMWCGPDTQFGVKNLVLEGVFEGRDMSLIRVARSENTTIY